MCRSWAQWCMCKPGLGYQLTVDYLMSCVRTVFSSLALLWTRDNVRAFQGGSRMKVELYLRSIMQEHPDVKVMDSGSERTTEQAECGDQRGKSWENWKFDWGAHKWRDGELRAPAESSKSDLCLHNRIDLLRLRKEKFGGLVFDPTTTVVLKVDEQGFEALNAMKSEKDPRTLSKALDIPLRDVEGFVEELGIYLF